ncbi:hypothetical protein HZ994_07115 [Akkermansiaceae bacterium]|nr:hypothetical protein HZ994_07115 [Akkermansiaceae bacterium]
METKHLLQAFPFVACLLVGCGRGWQMDYGKPEAQFLQDSVTTQGKAWVGKKITVKGVVTKVEVSDPNEAWVELENGIKCNFHEMRQMAESAKVGETVYVDGFLKRCDEGDVLIDPAMLRDPTAPFTPQ